jgi:ornithine cyclodeaminase
VTETLVLTRRDADGLLELETLAHAIEAAFRERGSGAGLPLLREHLAGRGGAFHVVAGGADLGSPCFTVKVNAHFGRPSGMTALFAADDGRLVALMDSAYLTVMRTAAMTVVVLRALGVRSAERALVVGAGRQGSAQATTLRRALPALRHLAIHDRDTAAAHAAAGAVGATVAEDLAGAAREAQVIVTATPARTPILTAGMVRAGAVVCAYGADAPGKRELDAELLRDAQVIVDVRSQALAAGELQHAPEPVTEAAVEIGDLLASRAARHDGDGIVVYDATGTAIQDAVAASQLVAAAERVGRGMRISLDG